MRDMTGQTLYYLGPQGSLTEEAARQFSHAEGVPPERVSPCAHVAAVLEKVAGDETVWGVVPAENSTEGSVNLTWDLLLADERLTIVGELPLRVRHHLLAQRGLRLSDVGAVLSHPQALAQCREFLRNRLPNAKQYETASTAEAVRVVSVNQLPLAAIGSETASRLYGLDPLASDIQDLSDNATRFLLVRSTAGTEGTTTGTGAATAPTGRDRTSLVCAGERDRPGSLRDILSVFADRGINLSRIESRPARRRLGEYVFYLDLEGHIADPEIAAAVELMRGNGWLLRVLGSYPRAKDQE